MFVLLATFLVIYSSCTRKISEHNVITVNDGGKAFTEMMHLNRRHPSMGIIIKENTLNDTAMMWTLIKIPPRKTGHFFRVDCFRDSMAFSYQPYKATKGKLVVQYYSNTY